jgi:GNAT superfamily N-acetyltransferase
VTGYSAPRPISADDDTSSFSSGDRALDEWLKRYALVNHTAGAARVYVTLHDAEVAGYYALAATSIMRDDATRRAARAMPQPVPAILLGRLAISQKEQGRGLGKHLLRDAITRTLLAADAIGVRVLLVHAASEEARRFYVHFGFEPSPTDPLHLMLMLKDARQAAREK